MNDTIRIGGVPEHFNLPIHQAIEKGNFAAKGMDMEWTTFKGGTGQMTRALRNDEVDVCILLTEGIIADIIKGNAAKIISLYIKTPLIWGVHTGVDNELDNYQDIFNAQYAISRFGSGSHLMAIVDANSKDKRIIKEQFTVIKNLKGALQSLAEQETDVFYWEKFTTKPYVDKGLLRRIGEYHTPWPCFVVAATQKVINEKPEQLTRMLRTIHESCDQFMIHGDESIAEVSERYQQKPKDVERWFHNTEWSTHGWVSDKMTHAVVYNLKTAGIIAADQVIPELIWKRN
jgi:ABC-type nitrate/sulfonate/bicarbonate transport system substrate-binding protein